MRSIGVLNPAQPISQITRLNCYTYICIHPICFSIVNKLCRLHCVVRSTIYIHVYVIWAPTYFPSHPSLLKIVRTRPVIGLSPRFISFCSRRIAKYTRVFTYVKRGLETTRTFVRLRGRGERQPSPVQMIQ